MTEETWVRGQGYTRENKVIPTVAIETRALPPADAPHHDSGQRRRIPPPRPPRKNWTDHARTILMTLISAVGVMLLVVVGVLMSRSVDDNEAVTRSRIDRWEERLDVIDSTLTQSLDEDLSGVEKQAIQLRLQHLTESWCADVGDNLDRAPTHLRSAYTQVCEAG